MTMISKPSKQKRSRNFARKSSGGRDVRLQRQPSEATELARHQCFSHTESWGSISVGTFVPNVAAGLGQSTILG
jgi:hypothetical protein